jgi:hypothetical protein
MRGCGRLWTRIHIESIRGARLSREHSASVNPDSRRRVPTNPHHNAPGGTDKMPIALLTAFTVAAIIYGTICFFDRPVRNAETCHPAPDFPYKLVKPWRAAW